MKTRIFAAILTALLIMAAVAGTAAATYDPIADNGMKAYVWYSNAEPTYGWDLRAGLVADALTTSGFNVTFHATPTPSVIYQNIEDNDMKIYWGIGHGHDGAALTGTGTVLATSFGASVEERDCPLTIGVFQHCGSYGCYTYGRWLQECTRGNDDVVAQRFYGEGWCGDEESGSYEVEECFFELLEGYTTMGYDTDDIFDLLELGYTYEDAVTPGSVEGRKQGNRDLRYPQFCGDVNYDMVVNATDVTLLQNHLISPSTYPVHSEWDADVNGDGSVDSRDALMLQQHVSSPEEFTLYPRGWFEPGLPKTGNIDGIGAVDEDDAIYLLRYTIFGEENYPLHADGDVDSSGDIDEDDAIYLLRYTIYGEEYYPLYP